MSKDLIHLKRDDRLRRIRWTPDTYFQFINTEAQQLHEKNQKIEWEYGDAALELFEQGVKPSQFNYIYPTRGQGFIYINSLFKTPSDSLKGVIELIPANNKGDHLDGKTSEGKDFMYKGKKIGVYTDEVLGGNTGGLHTDGKKQLPDLNPNLYSEKNGYFPKYPTLAGGFFVGEEDVLGQFRSISGVINENTFIINPLFRLFHCNNAGIQDPEDNSEFWYNRLIPAIFSDPLLDYYLKTLPLKENQKSEVTEDYRKYEPTAGFLKNIEDWKKMSSTQLQTGMERRLLYFSHQVYTDGYDLYLMSKFDIDQCKEIKGNAVILTNENTAYFIIEGKIVEKNEKPYTVKSINCQGISSSDSTKPKKYTGSKQVKEKIIKESILKGGQSKRRDPFYNVREVIFQCREQKVAINLNVQDESGRTALSHCIEVDSIGDLDLESDLRTLITSGANLFLEDKSGKTPCDYDQKMKIPRVLNTLLRFAKDDKNDDEFQRLHHLFVEYIARKLHNELGQVIDGNTIESDPSAEEKSVTAFRLPEIKMALETGTFFHTVVQDSPHLIYDIFSHFNINLSTKDHLGMTAFDYFLTKKQSHPDDEYNLERFLEKGADFTVEWDLPFTISSKLQSKCIAPLLFAEAAEGKFEKFLLTRKCFDADIYQRGSGLRLLHFAVRHHNLEIIKLLLQSGANPNANTLDALGGYNPLHLLMTIATDEPKPELQIEIIRQFLAANIDLSAPDYSGKTVLDLAPDFLKPLIVDSLEKFPRSRPTSSNLYNLYNSSPPLTPRRAEQEQIPQASSSY